MRNLLITAALLLSFTVPVLANGENEGNRGFCNGPGDDCNYAPTTNEGGDAYARAKAEADASAYAKSIGINYNKLDVSQQQSLRNHVTNIAKQGQGQGQALIDKSSFEQTFEAQERDPVSSAYGHASHRYECVVGIGGGAQAANFGISISGGYESELCNMGFVAKFLAPGDPRLNKLVDAMYQKVMNADTPEGPAPYSTPDS